MFSPPSLVSTDSYKIDLKAMWGSVEFLCNKLYTVVC